MLTTPNTNIIYAELTLSNQTCHWVWICWKNIKYVQLVNSITMLKYCKHKVHKHIVIVL
jgi:hypothetical protein